MSIVLDLNVGATSPADGTTVRTLTPSVGSALSLRAGEHVTTSNRGRRVQGTSAGELGSNQTLASADYRVIAHVRWLGSETNAGLRLFARSPNTTNGAQLLWFGNSLSIRNLVSGTGTNLTGGTPTFAFTPTAGTDYIITLEVIGSTGKGYIDGVERVSGTNVSATAADNAAWRTEGAVSTPDVTTVGWHFSRYQVELVGGGGSSNAPRSQFYHHMGMR